MIRFRSFNSGSLGDLRIQLGNAGLIVEGAPVGGILWRVFPQTNLSASYPLNDQPFCTAEVGATWLAALNLESVLAINRYSPLMWYNQLRWPAFRWLLHKAKITVSSLHFGSSDPKLGAALWLPYLSGRPLTPFDAEVHAVMGSALTVAQPAHAYILVCGTFLGEDGVGEAEQAARQLDRLGICLAEIRTDHDGKIFSVNPQPSISDPILVDQAAALISNAFHAHLHHR
jgi:hypothetical protein